MRRLAGTLVAALFVAGAAIAGGEPRLAQLEAARATWKAGGPDAYRYVLRRRCYCGRAATQPIAVTVRGGRVTAFSGQAGLAVPEGMRESLRTIPQWFDYVGRNQSRDWHRVAVEYHDRLGYPVRIAIDRDERLADDEVTWILSGLRPLAP